MKTEVLARRLPSLFYALCASGMVLLSSCESRRFSHDPPPGFGSLVVDNRTGDRLLLYIDGSFVEEISYCDHEIYDLAPGLCRVVLDKRSGYRSWRGDVDILDGQLTVMEVNSGYSTGDYSVHVYFD